jgi:hypothetical protein
MRRFVVLHARMQGLLREWDAADDSVYADAWANVLRVDFLREMQAALDSPRLDEFTLRARLESNFQALEGFAAAIQSLAAGTSSALARLLTVRPSGELPDISELTFAPLEPSHRLNDERGVVSPEA